MAEVRQPSPLLEPFSAVGKGFNSWWVCREPCGYMPMGSGMSVLYHLSIASPSTLLFIPMLGGGVVSVPWNIPASPFLSGSALWLVLGLLWFCLACHSQQRAHGPAPCLSSGIYPQIIHVRFKETFSCRADSTSLKTGSASTATSSAGKHW